MWLSVVIFAIINACVLYWIYKKAFHAGVIWALFERDREITRIKDEQEGRQRRLHPERYVHKAG